VVKVAPVFARHAHHAAASGYPRFVDRLDGLVRVRTPHRARVAPPVLDRVASRIEYEWFGRQQVRLDLTAALRLVTRRDEVVHLLYGETDHFYAGRLRRIGHRLGNRLVATFHQPPSLLDRLVPAPALFEQLDHAIALGPRSAAHLEGLVGPGRVSCAFNGVDTSVWRPRPGRAAAEPTCAFVGSWLRDFDTFEHVVRAVHAASPGVRFEVVTAPDRIGALSALPAVRARAGISDAELRSVYERSWVHVLPLTDAVSNNALLEGMSCGLATVVSAVGDVAHYTGDDGAMTVPPRDPRAMAAAVLAVLADRGARERLGSCARARAEARDWSACARRHAEIYEAVSASPASRRATRSATAAACSTVE
jgi:glycosyltransferase involved in cell wall biosynthesis